MIEPRRGRRYSLDHLWAEPDGDKFIVGIAADALRQLGEVRQVELPRTGDRLEAGRSCGVIESAKTAADLYAPISGVVVAINPDPLQPAAAENLGSGWLFRVKPDDASQWDGLLTAEEYRRRMGAD